METNVDLNMWNIKKRNKTADLVQEFYNCGGKIWRICVYVRFDGAGREDPDADFSK